jgi:hypothetical protein
MLPVWERHTGTSEFEDRRWSFARAIKGLGDKA